MKNFRQIKERTKIEQNSDGTFSIIILWRFRYYKVQTINKNACFRIIYGNKLPYIKQFGFTLEQAYVVLRKEIREKLKLR